MSHLATFFVGLGFNRVGVTQGRITEVVATCNHRQHNAGTHFSRNLTMGLKCGV